MSLVIDLGIWGNVTGVQVAAKQWTVKWRWLVARGEEESLKRKVKCLSHRKEKDFDDGIFTNMFKGKGDWAKVSIHTQT